MRIALALLLLLSAAASADAQYFGRNKVQYDRRDLLVLKTPHFDIYYATTDTDAAQIAARMAERWYDRLSKVFDHAFSRRQPVVLYGSHSQFAQTSIIPGFIDDGIGGFTDHLAGRVVLPFSAGLRETDHVLGHELVHAFQRDILRAQHRSLGALPLWFTEGMAEHLSIGELDANTLMWLRDAVATGELPALTQLNDPRWFPYRYGQAFWQFFADTYGDGAVVAALRSRAKGGALGQLQAIAQSDARTLSTKWHDYIRRVAPVPETAAVQQVATAKRAEPQLLLSAAGSGGRMNVAPRLSPDGRYVVFLSERDGLSIDIYLADARSGAIIDKLVSTAADAHLDSLQFMESAGAWDPAGHHFVYATVQDGRALLTIVAIPSGKVVREIPIAGVDQIFNPAWSPDGRRLAFSGMHGGVTDLFTLDLGTGEATPLTDDPYSDIQPSWSPDGTRLVFSSDRFSTSPDRLVFGPYQLVTVDVESGVTRLEAAVPGSKAIDPQWASDSVVYFVSDRGGISNVHRLHVPTGRIEQVTHVSTGVSGLTALSPAISVGDTGRLLAMTVYSGGEYRVMTVPLEPNSVETDPVSGRPEPLVARASVPPFGLDLRPQGGASESTRTSRLFSSTPYVPSLSLAQLGTPYLSAGGGAFGSFLRGGMSLGFSDLLGQQELAASVQVGKDSTDNAIVVSYANRRSRWNWGLGGGRIPALVGASDSLIETKTDAGDSVLQRQTAIAQQVHRQASAFASYPFSRAQRIEANVGVDAMTFDRRITTGLFAPDTRVRIADDETTHASLPSATLVQTGAALVYDTAVFGPTSPWLGQRYRFGLSQTTGDLFLTTATADYRRYVMPHRGVTLAFRTMGAARLGADAADPRLLPLVWNLRDMVRGFDTDARTIRTSRYIVGNVELRMPISTGGGVGRALPLELFAFADCGRFWTPDGASFSSTSACASGGGARLNAAGFIFEFNLARPLVATPHEGWRFGVAFRPGF